jgi:hypothetical protein
MSDPSISGGPNLADWLSAAATIFAFFASAFSAGVAFKALKIQDDQVSAYKSINVGISSVSVDSSDNEAGHDILETLVHIKNFGQTPTYFKILERTLLLNGQKIFSDFNGTDNRVLMPSQGSVFSLGDISVESLEEGTNEIKLAFKIASKSAIFENVKHATLWECWSIKFFRKPDEEHESTPDIMLVSSKLDTGYDLYK